jgi:hypothetical protein
MSRRDRRHNGPMDLDGVLDELYGAPPERFTARRDELTKQARAEGDKDLAATVHALRRPTAAAWVVNALARQAPEAVGALVELGVRMREAQSVLSGAQMRTLSRERQRVLADLVRQATALAAGPVSPSVSQEVEETLRAAVSDEDAADAVRTGCLTHGLSYSGLGPVDTSTATARHLRAVPGTASDHEQGTASGEEPGEASGEERGKASGEGPAKTSERAQALEEERRHQHERELAEAESALRSSERAAAAAAARADRARQRAQEAEEEVAERERAWQAAREASDRAGDALEAAVQQAAAAEGVAKAAREEVERVRSEPAGFRVAAPGSAG